MRLTLRTLLAYLDEILDPHDAELLRAKIADSEFATSLVHQIRGSVRRLRLDAPALDAQGIGADLNSVAEYLDNTLPPDHVPALEKICLDNEIHLGEVAGSHQILTLVLGQAADISDSLRNRVYAIAPTVEQPRFSPPVSGPPAPHIQPTSAPDAPHARRATPAQEPVAETAAPATPVTAPTPDTNASTLPPDVTASPPGATPRRPSERFAKPQDMPSTKEAWRAEALEHAAEESATVPAAAEDTQRQEPVAVAVAVAKKSSWLRTLSISTLIVILLVAGLLVAAGSLNQNLLRWLRLDSATVAARDEAEPPAAPAFALPEAPPETMQVERKDNAPPEQATSNDTAAANAATTDEIPDAELLTTDDHPIEAAPAELVPAPSGPELFPPASSGSDATEMTTDEQAGDRAIEFPSLEPATGSDPDTDRQPMELVPPGQTPGDVVVDLVEVDPSFPPKPRPMSDDPDSTVASSRTDANLPRAVGDSPIANNPLITEPIAAPNLDLDPVAVNPPVASAAPATSAESLFPSEPAVPEPEEARVLEPTRLRSGDQLVLVFDPNINDWKRLDATLPMSAGESLLSLPAFRADLEVGTHFTCTMVGATRLRLGPDPYLTLDSGQLILKTKTANRAQGIQHRGEVFDIWTAEPDGVVTIEASRVLVPGSDPMNDVAHTVLRIQALMHDASVRFKGQTFEVPQGQQLLRVDNFAPRLEQEQRRPKWTSAISVSRADTSTVRDWKGSLNDAQSMRRWLRERAMNQQYNQRALASRCLAEMDQFDAIVAALNDEGQHAFWDQHFETLQRALTRGPEVVQRITLELEKRYGPAAGELLEMIRGYDERQLAQGGAAKLVANLEHETLAYRVLAIQNLKRITSFTHLFRAEDPIGKRRRYVKKWQSKLRSGLVTYAKPPEIVTLVGSFTGPATENL